MNSILLILHQTFSSEIKFAQYCSISYSHMIPNQSSKELNEKLKK